MSFDKNYAAAAKALRLRKGYSQAELGFRYGVAQAQISRIEAGSSTDALSYFDFLTLLPQSTERALGVTRVPRKGTAMTDQAQYNIVVDHKDLLRARKALEKAVRDVASKRTALQLGHQGDTFDGKVYFLEALDMWTAFGGGGNDTYWNTYGLGNPLISRDMICHLTVPEQGINRRLGAAYASDDDGNIIIMHRGKIGGGREGVGKSAFWERAKVKTAFVQDGDRVSEMAIVGRIGSKTLLKDIRGFVREVKRVKDEITKER